MKLWLFNSREHRWKYPCQLVFGIGLWTYVSRDWNWQKTDLFIFNSILFALSDYLKGSSIWQLKVDMLANSAEYEDAVYYKLFGRTIRQCIMAHFIPLSMTYTPNLAACKRFMLERPQKAAHFIIFQRNDLWKHKSELSSDIKLSVNKETLDSWK